MYLLIRSNKSNTLFFSDEAEKGQHSLTSNQQLERFNEEANNNSRSGVAISGDEPVLEYNRINKQASAGRNEHVIHSWSANHLKGYSGWSYPHNTG